MSNEKVENIDPGPDEIIESDTPEPQEPVFDKESELAAERIAFLLWQCYEYKKRQEWEKKKKSRNHPPYLLKKLDDEG